MSVESQIKTLGFVLVLIMLVPLVRPRAWWWVQDGWKFKNAEPSDLVLVAIRVSALIGILIGIAICRINF